MVSNRRAVIVLAVCALCTSSAAWAQVPVEEIPETWGATGRYAAMASIAIVLGFAAYQLRKRIDSDAKLELGRSLDLERTRSMRLASQIDELRQELRYLNRKYRNLWKAHSRVLGRLEASGDIPLMAPTTLEESDTGRHISHADLKELREVLGRN